MKRPVIYAGVAALLLLLRFPFQKSDVGQLQPVEVLSVSIRNGVVVMETDTQDMGLGQTLEEALSDLEKTTAGDVFLDTADYILVTAESEYLLPQLAENMRPGCALCVTAGEIDLTAAAKYLANHKPALTLRQYRAGERDIPKLISVNGRLYLE